MNQNQPGGSAPQTMFRSDLFRGQRILVTGGGTGLGLAMAERLASLGASLHLWGRRAAVLEEAAAGLRQRHGAEVHVQAVDIRDAEAVDAAVEAIWTQHGALNALVNNAAGNFISPTEKLSPRGFNAIADTVFRGTFYTTQAVGKRWIAQGTGGAVLSIVVTWVWTGSPFVVPSAMSKAGIDAMTKSLAIEWGRHGIRLNAIAPGVIPTEGASARLRPKDSGADAQAQQNPMRRLGTGHDIGELAAFLLSPGYDWINGQTIALDGGDYLANGAYFKQYAEWSDADWAAARQAIEARTAQDKAQRSTGGRMTDSTIHAGGERLSGAALAARGEQVAAGLAALGVREGDVIAVLLRNGLPYLEIIQACKRLGCYYCPINWHFTAAEVAFLVADSGARLLIANADLWPPLRDALPAELPVLLAGPGAAQSGKADYDAWRDSQQPYDGPRVAPRGHMAYTSGTTGRPKGVVRAPFPLEHLARHLEQVEAVVEAAYGLRPGSHALLPAPIYHSAPSVFAQVALRVCETFVVTDRFDPAEVLRLIEAHRIDTVYLVPIMYVRLLKLDAAARAAHDLSSLRFVASTGAPCAPEIKRAMIDWLGPIIHETYASSEAGMVTVIDSDEALARPGSAGRPIGDAQVRIYAEDGSPCAPGQVGRIHVRQPAYADFTYRNNPQARAEVEKDGLIGLGDLGYLDADGYLYVCDRESDLVISGGVNIYPAEIEHQLMQYPGVADCAVFGVPDDEYGERLMALVQPAAGAAPEPAAMAQWLAQRIARYKVPRDLALRAELPRDDNGKIAKRRLRAEFWTGRQRKV